MNRTKKSDLLLAENARLREQVEALEAERDRLRAGLGRYVSAHDGPTGSLARCMAAEAQVEALTETLKVIADNTNDSWAGDVAREALSRVSRSEPAPPNDLASEVAVLKEKLRLANQALFSHPETGMARPAPPVPEEQQ